MSQILGSLKSGERARLIPTVADSKREERATSALLAVFTAVPKFARDMLADIGAPAHKRARVTCMTEIVFKPSGDKRLPRPDGLIIVESSRSTWSALVEAKVGNATLQKEQCEEYLDLAKNAGVDAVITISNQFSAVPTHHPVQVARTKTRKVGLYHFSWLGLMSKAILLADGARITDPEQSFLLAELIRYLRHDSSGVHGFSRMGKGWKTICGAVQQGVPLKRTSEEVTNTIADWHELSRYLALELTMALSRPVQVSLSRAHQADPEGRVKDDIDCLVKNGKLKSDFSIPDAASRLSLTADIRRRTLNVGMEMQSPEDRKRPTAAINWLTRQVQHVTSENALLRVTWPRRTPNTAGPLKEVMADPSCVIPEGQKSLPARMEIVQVVDLAGKFRGANIFVDHARSAVRAFYKEIGQHLTPWVPRPPKMKKVEKQPSPLEALSEGESILEPMGAESDPETQKPKQTIEQDRGQ